MPATAKLPKISENDRKILRAVQEDANIPARELATRLAMSPSSLYRRMNEMEKRGIITKRVALLDAEKIGLDVSVFVQVSLVDFAAKARADFERFIMDRPEIMECFLVTGESDYILLVRSDSIRAFEEFLMNEILMHPSVARATSQISLKQQKYSTILPI